MVRKLHKDAYAELASLRAQISASNDAVEGEFLSLHTKITELTVKLAASEAAQERVDALIAEWTEQGMYPKSQKEVAAPLFAAELAYALAPEKRDGVECTCKGSPPPTDMMMVDPDCPKHGNRVPPVRSVSL